MILFSAMEIVERSRGGPCVVLFSGEREKERTEKVTIPIGLLRNEFSASWISEGTYWMVLLNKDRKFGIPTSQIIEIIS
jgi:hypothetical protein